MVASFYYTLVRGDSIKTIVVGIIIMKRNKLDKIDRQIVSLLQENGRMTNVDLAEKVGISAPPCLRRVKALEDHGVIQSYHARIDRQCFGYEVTVFAQVKLEKQDEASLNDFRDLVAGMPRVRECHLLAGDIDAMLKVVAKSWDDYQEFCIGELTAASNVSSVKSIMVMRSVKDQFGIPLDEVEESKAA